MQTISEQDVQKWADKRFKRHVVAPGNGEQFSAHVDKHGTLRLTLLPKQLTLNLPVATAEGSGS